MVKIIHKSIIMYDINQAIDLLYNTTKQRNFDESVDVVIKISNNLINQKIIKGTVKYTFPLKKLKKILVLSDDLNDIQISNQLNVMHGGKDLVDSIKNTKKINFDLVITTPIFFKYLNVIGSILGPKKLMPNLSLGTITTDIATKIKNIQEGENTFISDKYGNIHKSIGKLSFDKKHILQNLSDLVCVIKKHFGNKFNDSIICKMFLSTTMSRSYKINLKSIL